MLLPTPTTDEVLRFQTLYREQYAIDLPMREAVPLLTRLVQFYYLSGGHDARRQRLQQPGTAVRRPLAHQQTPADRKPSSP